MKPQIETPTLPLSIADVDSTVYLHPETTASPATMAAAGAPDGLSGEQMNMLAAVACRAGQVEAAQWALDQAQAVADEQIVAALSLGLPSERVAMAAGVPASQVAEIIAAQAPTAD
jgi:hypothetical protein